MEKNSNEPNHTFFKNNLLILWILMLINWITNIYLRVSGLSFLACSQSKESIPTRIYQERNTFQWSIVHYHYV